MQIDLIVIGGGAAGFFAAITAKSSFPNSSVVLLEKTSSLLSKVRISGGGRCNVTHSCFEPSELVKNYPRGHKELLGPFHRFQPKDTIEWFRQRGVILKTESDGRMFPITDSSQTIIDCLLNEAKKVGVTISLKQSVESIEKTEEGFCLTLSDGSTLHSRKLILATGSNPQGYEWARSLGHMVESPVPSLFTFNIPNSPLKELSGIAISPVTLWLEDITYSQKGPLLITHFGFSGPATIKLSAWAARYLHEKGYKCRVYISWIEEAVFEKHLSSLKKESPQKYLQTEAPLLFPKNLWKHLTQDFQKRIGDLSSSDIKKLKQKLLSDSYLIEGKTTHKEEFVTCGGVSLKEISFKTMESKVCPGLYFAGEILNIDGITGGFNFQNAWTTGYIAGTSSLSDS